MTKRVGRIGWAAFVLAAAFPLRAAPPCLDDTSSVWQASDLPSKPRRICQGPIRTQLRSPDLGGACNGAPGGCYDF